MTIDIFDQITQILSILIRIVENMRRLADEQLQITLALSLHGSTQEKRQELMPIANKYDIHEGCMKIDTGEEGTTVLFKIPYHG